MVASSSDIPPDKKWIPGTAAGTPLSMVCVVQWATSSGVADGASRPVQNMCCDATHATIAKQQSAAEALCMLLLTSLYTEHCVGVTDLGFHA